MHRPAVKTSFRSGKVIPSVLLVASVLVIIAGGLSARYGTSWPRRLYWPRPEGIVIHHSASPAVARGRHIDAEVLDKWHDRRGWGHETLSEEYHIGYHYVVLTDGTVQAGRPEWMRGAHCAGHNDYLGICVIGNFSSKANPRGTVQPARPTRQQLDSLHSLLTDLLNKYDMKPDDVYPHSDLGQTACPGDRFPFEKVTGRLRHDTEEK